VAKYWSGKYVGRWDQEQQISRPQSTQTVPGQDCEEDSDSHATGGWTNN